MSYFEFPHTRNYDGDLGYIIKKLNELADRYNNFFEYNSIKFHDPYEWNIETSYPAFNIVYSEENETLYISKKEVPAGISIDNTDYWELISPFKIDEGLTTTSINPVSNRTLTLKFNSIDEAITALNSALSGETTARTSADTDLSNRITAIDSALDGEITARMSADTELSARITAIASLTQGSTTGDAELIDARTGANGISYSSAGNAIRGQYNSAVDLINIYNGISTPVDGAINGYGNITTNAKRRNFGIFKMTDSFKIKVNTGYNVAMWQGFALPLTDDSWQTLDANGELEITLTDGDMFAFNFKRTDNGDFTASDDIGFKISVNGSYFDDIISDVDSLSDEVLYINGDYPLLNGMISALRVFQPNTKRATTGILHITNPFTISIGSGWQLLVMQGGATGNFTDKGWVIVNGGSWSPDLEEGTYFAFNMAKTSLTDIDTDTALADSKLKLIIANTNNERFDNEINTINTLLNSFNVRPVYTVDINGGGDYTSILSALKGTADYSHIIVKPGVYNMISEYESYYGSDYFTNYSGYDLSDIFSRGYNISAGRYIEFEPGAVVQCRYTGSNNYVKTYFSVFNTGYNATIEGAYIYYCNTRYCVHDDGAGNNEGTNTFKNIIIKGYPSSASGMHWGGGCGKKNTYYFDNIVFLDDEMPANYGDFYYHSNEAANTANRIVVNNCCGGRACFFTWLGESTEPTYCVVSGSKFKSIFTRAGSGSPLYENMILIKYNNTED